jgi:hypothetical protein
MTEIERVASEIARTCLSLKGSAERLKLKHLSFILDMAALEAANVEMAEFGQRKQQNKLSA